MSVVTNKNFTLLSGWTYMTPLREVPLGVSGSVCGRLHPVILVVSSAFVITAMAPEACPAMPSGISIAMESDAFALSSKARNVRSLGVADTLSTWEDEYYKCYKDNAIKDIISL